MRFGILGPLEVIDGDRVLEINSHKQRALLAMLLLSPNRVIAAERMLDELWDEDPPAAGLSALRFHVSKLRDALQPDRRPGEEGVLVTRTPGYSIIVDPDDLDSTLFERLVRDARRIALSDPATASALLTNALDLWRGPALADFLDEPFAETEVRRLEELYLTAIEERINTDLATGRHTDVIPELRKLTSENPYRERLWGQLMIALYRANRQADALRTYQTLRKQLGDDLGLEPSKELQSLEARILLEEEELKSPGAIQPPGGRLRGYELVHKLGEGAFGVVWRARQPAVGRDVAIKVIKPELSNRPGFIRRFESEARLVASLEHPHIVPVLDFWRDPDGAYLVMRLMPGGAVEQSVTAQLPADEVVVLLEQVGSALSFAHRRGLVHADLHPGNVLLDGDGNAVLADFGLAARLADESSTPPACYTSPEQQTGAKPTAASDVFCMGRLAHRLFTGVDPSENGLGRVSDARNDLPERVDEVLARATAVALDERYPGVEEFLADLRVATGRAAPPRVEARNPYKGLRAFEESDVADFFGRASLTNELLEAVASNRLVTIVGPSGSGKSSAVRAGLVPALRRGRLNGSDTWLISDMYPGSDPFAELAQALGRVAVVEPPDLVRRLRNPATLVDAISESLPDDATFLLLVDQFEELFTVCPDPEVRRDFMAALELLATTGDASVRLLLTLRADFYGLPLQSPSFGSLLRESVISITPPNAQELGDAIELPARQVGVSVEPELVATAVVEVGAQPGGLPLLQYALTQLFDERDGNSLTLEDYTRAGGLVGALAGWPEQVYTTLTSHGKDAARQVWLRLVAVHERGLDTRRRVPVPELYELGIVATTIDRVLTDYGEARLITFDRDAETRLPTAEVAHEALLRRWERLAEWVEARREALVLHRRLRHAVRDWADNAGDPGYLLTGGRLEQFEVWARGTDLAPSETEKEYLDLSRAAEDASASRRSRIRRAVAASLAGLALTSAVFAVVAFEQRDEADEQRELAQEQEQLARDQAALAEGQRQRAEDQTTIAEERADDAARSEANAEEQAAIAGQEARLRSQEQQAAVDAERLARARGLASAAMANIAVDPELSVLLAIEAVETTRADDGTVLPEAEVALHAALSSHRLVAAIPTQFYTRSVTFSPDGTTLYIGGFQESQVATAPFLETPLVKDSYATAVSVVAGVDDEFLVVGDFDGGLFALDRETLEELFSLDGHEDWITDIAVSADGTRVATLSGLDGKAFVWDLEKREPIREFALDCGEGGDCTVGITLSEAKGVALSTDGGRIGFADTVWNVADGSLLPVSWEDPGGAVVEFLPDGERIVVADGSEVRIVDLNTGATLDSLYAHTSEITRVAVSHDGSRLATAARDGLIHIWELGAAGAGRVLTLAGHTGPAWEVAFSPDGRYLASAGGLQDFSMGDWSLGVPYVWEARIWDLAPAAGREWMSTSLTVPVAAFHRDGTRLLAPSSDGVSVWDTDTGTVVDTIALPNGSNAEVLAVSPVGGLVVVGGDAQPGPNGQRGWLALYDPSSGEPLRELIAVGAGPVPTDVAFGPDGSLVAAVTEAEIIVWDTATGDITFHHDNTEVRPQYAAVGFSSDGTLLVTLAVTGEDPLAYPGGAIWNLQSGEHFGFIGKFARGERADVSFSSTEPLVLTAGVGRPTISEAYTGMNLGILQSPVSYAGAAEFSPDGSLIATGEADGTVGLWDSSTTRLEMTLTGHESEVVAVAFSNDGTKLASVDLEGILRVWALDIDDLLAIARSRVTRDLTDAECTAYLPETCSAAAKNEPLLPADYKRTVPPGVTEEAWAAAPPGGTWEHAAAEGFTGDILAYNEHSQLLLVEDDGFRLVDPVSGVSQAASDMPLLDIGEEKLIDRYTAAATYDPYNDRIMVYMAEQGGVLAYDADNDAWTELAAVEDLMNEEELEPDPLGIVHGPFGDYGQALVYDSESELIVLYGGATWGRFEHGNHVGLSQTWLYDPATNIWEQQESEIAPSGRVGHAMAYDAQSDRIILFGGSPGFAVDGDIYADTWAFDANTGTWTEMSPADSPPAREGALMWYDPTVDLTFLFGGTAGFMPWEVFGGEELWAYDYDSDTWTLYRVDPNPGYRTNSGVIFDEESGVARLYGGDWYDPERRFRGFIPDMWTYRHESAG